MKQSEMKTRDKKPFDQKRFNELYLHECGSLERRADDPPLLWLSMRRVLSMEYTQGRDFTELTKRMTKAVSVLHARKLQKRHRYPNYEYFDREVAMLLAFALALPIGDATWTLLNEHIFSETGADCYVDRILASQFPGRAVAKRETWEETAPWSAKFLSTLYDAIDAPPEIQSKLLQKHLKKWNRKSYRDSLTSGYFGEFAYELAAVVMAFNLDDSAFRDNIYYPVELVDYYRSRTKHAITTPSTKQETTKEEATK